MVLMALVAKLREIVRPICFCWKSNPRQDARESSLDLLPWVVLAACILYLQKH